MMERWGTHKRCLVALSVAKGLVMESRVEWVSRRFSQMNPQIFAEALGLGLVNDWWWILVEWVLHRFFAQISHRF